MKTVLARTGMILMVLLFAGSGHAQYSLKSSAFAPVNTASSAGTYSVKSTIGTTGGAARAAGGSFSVTSSPWMVAVVETPSAPKLSIAAAGDSVKVSWPSPSIGWLLQQNTNSVNSANWSNVTATIQDDGTTKTLIANPPRGNRFYRLFKP